MISMQILFAVNDPSSQRRHPDVPELLQFPVCQELKPVIQSIPVSRKWDRKWSLLKTIELTNRYDSSAVRRIRTGDCHPRFPVPVSFSAP